MLYTPEVPAASADAGENQTVPPARLTASSGTIGLATVGAGLLAGFFVTYQISVIRGLALVDDASYVLTFQAINDTVRSPWFAMIFFGTQVVLLVALVTNWNRSNRALLGGALAMSVAAVAVTFAGNVPLNRELGSLGSVAGTEHFAAARAAFESEWNNLNLIRTLLSVGAFVTTVVAFVVPARPS